MWQIYEIFALFLLLSSDLRGHEEYITRWTTTNLKAVMPLGFQSPVESYSPRYELVVDKDKEEQDFYWINKKQLKFQLLLFVDLEGRINWFFKYLFDSLFAWYSVEYS